MHEELSKLKRQMAYNAVKLDIKMRELIGEIDELRAELSLLCGPDGVQCGRKGSKVHPSGGILPVECEGMETEGANEPIGSSEGEHEG